MYRKDYVVELTRADAAAGWAGPSPHPRGYLLRVAGEGGPASRHGRTLLTWDDELNEQLRAIRASRCSESVRMQLGERLRRFLLQGGWGPYESGLRDRLQRGDLVHVTISSQAPELYQLPWELLLLQESGQHLGEFATAIIAYAWPGTTTMPRGASNGRERVLLAWSEAGGAVPTQAHIDALRAGCGPRVFDPERDVLAAATLPSLDAALTRATATGSMAPVTHLHVLCHGASGDGRDGLWLSDPRGERALVSPARLRHVVATHGGHLRSVVLCVCGSGDAPAADEHAVSVAQALHRAGLAWVIGSRFPLSKRGSVAFAGHFYRELFERAQPVGRAFAGARRALALDAGTDDWASLQVYARPERAPVGTVEPAGQPELTLTLYNQAAGMHWRLAPDRTVTLRQLVALFRREVRRQDWPDGDLPRPGIHHRVQFFRDDQDAEPLPESWRLRDLVPVEGCELTLNVGWSLSYREPAEQAMLR